MTLKDSASLIASLRSKENLLSKEAVLDELAAKAINLDSDYGVNPAALVDTLEACTMFIMDDVKPFVVNGKIVHCPISQMSKCLKILLALTEPVHLLKDYIPRQLLTPELKQRLSAVFIAYWNHLQYLSAIYKDSSLQYACLEGVQTGPHGQPQPINPFPVTTITVKPKYFLKAFIALEATFLIALDTVLDGIHPMPKPLSIIPSCIKPIHCDDFNMAIAYGTHVPTAMLHVYVDRAWRCAQGREKFAKLTASFFHSSFYMRAFYINGYYFGYRHNLWVLAALYGVLFTMIIVTASVSQ